MDYRLEQLINGPAGTHPALDLLMRGIAGGAEVLFLGVIALWFLYGWITGRAGDRRGALTAFVAALGALAVVQVIDRLWARPRPFIAHPDTVHLLATHAADPSFPSDHVVAASAIAVVLVFFHQRWGVAALLFAAVLAYARVYIGVHYPGDVLGGFLVGTVVALVLVRLATPLMTWLAALVDRTIRLVRLPLPS
jgi:undecaprenyl-diphosphatase